MMPHTHKAKQTTKPTNHWGYCSVTDCLPSIHTALEPMSGTAGKTKRRKEDTRNLKQQINVNTSYNLKNIIGAGEMPVVKSTGISSRGLGFDTEHPHGSSQLSTTPVSGDPLF